MRPRLHVFNRNEGAGPWWKTAQWTLSLSSQRRYFGPLLKGWWKLGKSEITNYFELGIALGGEDNMLQFELVLPFVGRGAIGVRVPRLLTKSWIYQCREWSLRMGYIGRWVELLIGFDDQARDMRSFYLARRKDPDCANCNHYGSFHTNPRRVLPYSVKSLDDVERLTRTIENPNGRCITESEVNHGCAPCDCPGYAPAKPTWTRLALHPGFHVNLTGHPRDRLFGRLECTTTTGESIDALVPMPEGNYPAIITREVRVWKRARWPWPSRTRVDFRIDIPAGIPVPGKGENSWDCEDDAIFGTGGWSVYDAIGNAVRSAHRQRELYGGKNWRPAAGWPEAISR